MNDKFGEIAAQLAAIPSSEIRRDEIHQALNAAYKAGLNDQMEPLDEPDPEDREFAERAEDDKQNFFDGSRGVGQ